MFRARSATVIAIVILTAAASGCADTGLTDPTATIGSTAVLEQQRAHGQGRVTRGREWNRVGAGSLRTQWQPVKGVPKSYPPVSTRSKYAVAY